MKHVTSCWVVICVLAGVMTFTGVALAADAEKGPAEITLNQEGKKPALFPHTKHQEHISCSECHHTAKDDGTQGPYTEGMKIAQCKTCHTGDMLKGKVKGKTAMQRAGHGNCLACHKTEAKKDAKLKNIKKCSTCHPKKK